MSRILAPLLICVILAACTSVATPTVSMPPPAPMDTAPASTPTGEPTQPPPTLTAEAFRPADWAGDMAEPDGNTVPIVVQFSEGGGSFRIEPFTETNPVEGLARSGSTISFDVSADEDLHFSGQFDGNRLVGQVSHDATEGAFELLPLFADQENTLSEFRGTYELESGDALLINLAPEYSGSGMYFFGHGLMLTHFGTGAIRALYPVAEDTFLVGCARATGSPFSEQITFTRDASGTVTGLSRQSRDPQSGELGDAETADHLDLSSEEVGFTSEDGTELAGLLTLPPGPGPFPGIMMLHGSEPGTKDDFGDEQMSAFMASQGIAILTYDKRGVGESSGDYSESASEANLGQTAKDAIAGVEYLASRPEVDADNIGLTGFSQAGWVIPIAASQSEKIAYFLILSGPITSVGHERFYSGLTNNGETPSSYSQEELAERVAAAPHAGFDSTPVIAELDQPSLWVFGDQDKSIFVAETVSNLESIIAHGKTNLSYEVLANADHNLQRTIDGLFREIPFAPGYHGDYYRTLISWLEANVK